MVGGWEWVLIIVVVLVIFGAKRIPDIGRSLGQGIRGFKKELSGNDEESDKENTSNGAAGKP